MKRIRCPKCDEPILFDENLYEPGRVLVFECKACHKQFKLRLTKTPPQEQEEENAQPVWGHLVVIENVFHLKQKIPLYEGDNVVGRHVKGTKANAAFKTVDPSVDTTHCVVNVRINKQTQQPVFTLSDAMSNTGTFLMNNILDNKAKVIIQDGSIITIGATTMILRVGDVESEE